MLSKKAQYAFKALMYMADKKDNEPILIAEISKKKRIPLKFLENILLELKKAGILESKKGKGGGYFFRLVEFGHLASTPSLPLPFSRAARSNPEIR